MSKPYRPGRHTVIDMQTGFEHYDDEMVRQYDGLVVHHSRADPRHPQELARTRPERPAQQPLSAESADQFVAFTNLLLDEENNDFLMDEFNAPLYVEA